MQNAPTAPLRLDGAQREFVGSESKVTLLSAPPGTGKTQALLGRFIEQYSRGMDPGRILVATYTNQARQNFGDRLRRHCPALANRILDPADRILHPADRGCEIPLWIGTLHGICHRILQHHLALTGRKAPTGILDDSETMRRIENHLEDHGAMAGEEEQGRQRQRIRAALERGIPLRDPAERAALESYRKALKAEDLFDFSALLQETKALFTRFAKVREAWARSFDSILVDEYQDTDPVQTEILAMLAGHAQLAVCGDENQSIYGWRNATGSMDGAAALGETLRIRLETDYRLARPVQEAACALIGGEHPPQPSGKAGPAPRHVLYEKPEELGSVLTARIEDAKSKGAPLEQIAVLVRSNRHLQEVAKTLSMAGYPIYLPGRARALPCIRRMRAWLAFLLRPGTRASFERVAAAHGIHRVHYRKASRDSEAAQIETWAALAGQEHAPGEPEERQALIDLAKRAKALVGAEDGRPKTPIGLNGFLQITGLQQAFAQEAAAQGADGQIAEGYLEIARNTAKRCSSLLETAKMLLDSENTSGKTPEGHLVIQTMHSAKGMEWDHVMAPFWEEGVFPLKNTRDAAEEKRLAYVAITRAAKGFTSFSCARTGWNTPLAPSRFVLEAEIPVTDPDGNPVGAYA